MSIVDGESDRLFHKNTLLRLPEVNLYPILQKTAHPDSRNPSGFSIQTEHSTLLEQTVYESKSPVLHETGLSEVY